MKQKYFHQLPMKFANQIQNLEAYTNYFNMQYQFNFKKK